MIRLGTAGLFTNSYESSFKELAKNGLKSLEVEFTYGVRMKDQQAIQVGKAAKESGIQLSVHAPYYINLASPEQEKVIASGERILAACSKAHLLGATHVVFHPGFYMNRDPELIYDMIRERIDELIGAIKDNGWEVKLAPETTGKATQFGNVDELKRLMNDTGCSICVDFAHILARSSGKLTFVEIVDQVKDIKSFHAHFSGIEYTDKGEKRHILTDLDYARPLFRAIKEANLDVNMIIESPDPFGDCMKLKKLIV